MVRGVLFSWLSLLFFSVQAQSSREIAESIGLGSAFSQGVSIVDINDDGFDDLFITRRNRDNQFFINNGDASFTNIAAEARVDDIGLSALTIWSDFDQDGDQDFFLGMEEGRPKLYLNNGDLTFTNITEAALGDLQGYVASAQWGDVNGDGWEDLFVFILDGTNQFFFNNQNGGFENVTEQLGIIDKRLTMGAMLFDFDQDHDLDLYITHDGYGGNHFYVNDGVGVFTDLSIELGVYTETDAMGVAIGDYDNDGWQDIYLTNLYENQLFKNIEGQGFKEVAAEAGVDDYGMGWGASWIDYDNDGWLDLYTANDTYFSDYSNKMYINNQDGTFQNGFSGEDILSKKGSYATAVSDLNNDGVPEIIMANRGAVDRLEVFLFENNTNHNFISVKLSNPKNGSTVKVNTSSKSYIRGALSGTGWCGEDSDWILLGINNVETVDIEVNWLNGTNEEFVGIKANKFYNISSEGLKEQSRTSFEWPHEIVTNLLKEDKLNINTYIDQFINIFIYNNIYLNIYTYENKLIYRKSFEYLESLDLSFLSRGFYIISIESQDGIKSFKIFKK